MRQDKFLDFITPANNNLQYTTDNHGIQSSNTFRGVLQSAINPNPNKDKREYFVKYNPSVDTYFLCTKDGYGENLRYMGQHFRWNFWLYK